MRGQKGVVGVTLKMVAAKAGVSTAAVSYILRGQARAMRLSEACEQRVREAASELGYQGNHHAQSLASGRSRTIGVVINPGWYSVLAYPFWGMLSSGIERQTRRHGYDLQLIGGTDAESPSRRALAHLRSRRVDALVVYRLLQCEIPQELLDPALPVVFIESHDLARINRVNFDPEPGLQAALEHLAGLGHRDIMHLQHINVRARQQPTGLAEMPERGVILRRLAGRCGVRLDECILDHHERVSQSGLQFDVAAMARILQTDLELPARTTAIICENDETALALYHVLAARGLQVPDDLSVIGFDDMFAASAAIPSLTTISHRLEDMGGGRRSTSRSRCWRAGRRPERRCGRSLPS